MRGAWSRVDDGIVSGRLLHRLLPCGVCGVPTSIVRVTRYLFPEVVPWTATIIYKRGGHIGNSGVACDLGMGCGCYAKLHRQIAHIKDSMERRTW